MSTLLSHTSSQPLNIYPMATRAKNGISKPKGFFAQVIMSELVSDNETFKHPKWVDSMEKEYKALVANHTWVLVTPSEHTKIIGNKWMFHMKLKAYKSLERYKSRLVAKGYDQTRSIDYKETFSLW